MRAGPQDAEVAMFANKTRVLLVLPEDVLGQARVLAGRATAALKLPVSLQIVLRALIEEGLKRDGDRALLANVEDQAVADRKSTRLNSSHSQISYAVFCLKKKKNNQKIMTVKISESETKTEQRHV